MKKFARIFLLGMGGLLLILLLVQVALSPLVTKKVNEKLATLPGYSGHVDSIGVALWRGTVTADQFTFYEKKLNASPGTVVTVRSGSLSIAWLPLFKGRVGGHGKFLTW